MEGYDMSGSMGTAHGAYMVFSILFILYFAVQMGIRKKKLK